MYDYIRMDSPIGALTLAAVDEKLIAVVKDGQIYHDDHLKGEGREIETPALTKAREYLEAYFDGKDPDFSDLDISLSGSPFQMRVWKDLLRIPYGKTVSYGELSAGLGSSPRAVGNAVGRNPLLIIIPCHRVLGSKGDLRGYAAGIDAKKYLLELEAAASV